MNECSCVSGATHCIRVPVRHTEPFISSELSLTHTRTAPGGITVRTSLSLQRIEGGGRRAKGPPGFGDGRLGEVCVGVGQTATSPYREGLYVNYHIHTTQSPLSLTFLPSAPKVHGGHFLGGGGGSTHP